MGHQSLYAWSYRRPAWTLKCLKQNENMGSKLQRTFIILLVQVTLKPFIEEVSKEYVAEIHSQQAAVNFSVTSEQGKGCRQEIGHLVDTW